MPDLKAPIRLAGCNFDMYGGDREHSPRHFHIRKADEWELVVYYRRSVLEGVLIFEIKLPANKRGTQRCPLKKKQRKLLLKQIFEHLGELDAQWEYLNLGKPE